MKSHVAPVPNKALKMDTKNPAAFLAKGDGGILN
jgi:hypothetical protein